MMPEGQQQPDTVTTTLHQEIRMGGNPETGWSSAKEEQEPQLRAFPGVNRATEETHVQHTSCMQCSRHICRHNM